MNSFYISLSAVLPMFAMLALGVFLRRKGVVDENSLAVINRLCFRVFLAVNVYYNIYKGQWTKDSIPYHVIHRIASVPEVHGIFKGILDFCFAKEQYIRIDTHRDNHIMRHNMEKYGFTYCGIIYLANGDERLAFQKKHQRDKQI